MGKYKRLVYCGTMDRNDACLVDFTEACMCWYEMVLTSLLLWGDMMIDNLILFQGAFLLSLVASPVAFPLDLSCFRFFNRNHNHYLQHCHVHKNSTSFTIMITVAEWPHGNNNPLLWHRWTPHRLLVVWHQVICNFSNVATGWDQIGKFWKEV